MFLAAPMSVAYVAPDVHQHAIEGHLHEFFEVAFVLGGDGVHRTETGQRGLRRGDVLVLPPGTWHGYTNCRDLWVMNCCVSPAVARHELAWTRADSLLGALLWPAKRASARRVRLDEPGFARVLELVDDLRNAAGDGRKHAESVGLLTVLLARLGAMLGIVGDARPASPIPEAVVAGIGMLEKAPGHPWRLTDLADAVHVTPSHLTRLFTTHTGASPMAYLARYRAELAAMMLRRTDAPVAAIGARVGWPDPNYFARRFRQHLGVSPTSYRARVGQWHQELRDTRAGDWSTA